MTGYPVASPHLQVKAVDREVLVHNKDTSKVHILNPAASYVLSLCDSTRTLDQISDELATAAKIAPAEARSHVAAIIDDFLRERLVSME
jgi:hypothetical protein